MSVPWSDNTYFPAAVVDFPLKPLTLMGLQNGGNVKITGATLTSWMAYCVGANNVNFAFAGTLAAANLSGTNTGDETFARIAALGFYGFTKANHVVSATMASASKNRITANSVTLTTPASPADFDEIYVFVESASITGAAIAAHAGQTVNGASSISLTQVPCYLHLQYNLAGTNWFVLDYRIGTL